jgi:hypothetical protein
MTRSDVSSYLDSELGSGKYTSQGLKLKIKQYLNTNIVNELQKALRKINFKQKIINPK